VLQALRYRLRAMCRRSSLEREMLEEMHMHLDQRAQALVASGMKPEEARLAARREFGNVAMHQEGGRDARGTQWLDALLGDIRFALRHFSRHRLATCTIVAVLSLGIAVHAVELTLLRIITVKPPPGISSSVPLARVRGLYRIIDHTDWRGRRMAYPEVWQIAALNDVFSSVAASTRAKAILGADDDERMVTVHFVNSDYFRTLGVDVLRGPGLPRSRPGSGAAPELAAVVGGALWERTLGRPDTVGQALLINGHVVRVTGVASPHFVGAVQTDDPGLVVWMPLDTRPIILAASGATAFAFASPDSQLFDVVGRLRDGVSADSATTIVRVVSATVTGGIQQPVSLGWPLMRFDADVVNLRGITDVGSDMGLIVALAGIFSTLILAVVCTNVSGLLAASAAKRGHEIAVRLSLGASRGRIVRQLLTESCLLSLGGSAMGVALYWLAFQAAAKFTSKGQFYGPDIGTVTLTAVSAFAVGILFGLTPALHAARGGVRGALSNHGTTTTGPSRLHRGLVTAQISLTQPLLVTMASLVVMLLTSLPKGLPERVQAHVVKFSLNYGATAGKPEAHEVILQRMVNHLRETPGVVGVVPDARSYGEMKFSLPGQQRVVVARYHYVQPGYFNLLDVPLVYGDDRVVADSMPTLVIGADLARSLLGDVNPVGHYIDGAPRGLGRERYLVTGVYDSRLFGEHGRPVVYRVVRNSWSQAFLVRTSKPAVELLIPIRRAIRAELPTTPIESSSTLTDLAASQHRDVRLGLLVMMGTVTVVLLISCIGLYGVVSLAVAQRNREIGIRMALGARAREVVSLFYRGGMKVTVMGLFFGLPVSLAGTYILKSVAGMEAQGGPSLALIGTGVGVVVFLVASLATVFPARRAATVDPVEVLRAD
jgi:predicted permease